MELRDWIGNRIRTLRSKRSAILTLATGTGISYVALISVLANASALYQIIGSAVLLLLLVVVLGGTMLRAQHKAAASGHRSGRMTILAVVVVVLGTGGTGVGVWKRVAARPSSSAPSVAQIVLRGQIDVPTDNATVGVFVDSNGRISGLGRGDQLMLLMFDGNCYFPGHTHLAADNTWWGRIQAGGDEAKGKSRTLYLADFGPNGMVPLKKYEDTENKVGYAPGICSYQDLIDKYQATIIDHKQITRAP